MFKRENRKASCWAKAVPIGRQAEKHRNATQDNKMKLRDFIALVKYQIRRIYL